MNILSDFSIFTENRCHQVLRLHGLTGLSGAWGVDMIRHATTRGTRSARSAHVHTISDSPVVAVRPARLALARWEG